MPRRPRGNQRRYPRWIRKCYDTRRHFTDARRCILEDILLMQEDVQEGTESTITVPDLSEGNTENMVETNHLQDLPMIHHDKGSVLIPEACPVEKGSAMESPETCPADKGSVMEFSEIDLSDQEPFYDCVSILLTDQELFCDCVSVLSTIPTEETVPNEEFYECSSVLSHHHARDIQHDKPPCSVLYKVSLSKDTPDPVFCDFKIPWLFMKQGNLAHLPYRWNPAKPLPTVEKKTEPVQDPIPRVKLKPTPNA
jgi:hypothetical protein